MAVHPIVTRPGATFTIPFASPAPSAASPSSSNSSSTLDSPLSLAQHRRLSHDVPSAQLSAHSAASEEAMSEKQRELEKLWTKSVTLILWLRANEPPRRYRLQIPHFPYFSLSEHMDKLSKLGLRDSDWVDAYDPLARTWEAEELSAVRVVMTQQRVLYRRRESITKGLSDDECPELDGERLQQEDLSINWTTTHRTFIGQNARKRSVEEPRASPPSKHHRSSSTYSSGTTASPQSGEGTVSQPYSPGGSSASVQLMPPAFTPPSSSPEYSPPRARQHLPDASSAPAQEYPQYTSNMPISPIRLMRIPTTADRSCITAHSSLALAVTAPPTVQRSSVPLPHLTQSSQLPLPLPHTQSLLQGGTPPPPTPGPPLVPPSTSTVSTPTTVSRPTPLRDQTPTAHGKSWPYGRFVCDIVAGFQQMDELMRKESPVKQQEAFERVFNVAYKKSTVCNHRKVWRNAQQQSGIVLAEWVGRGREESALWSEFVRVVEGKEPRRNAGMGMGAGAGPGTGVGTAVMGAAVHGMRGGGGQVFGDLASQAFGSPQGGVLSLGGPTMSMPGPGPSAGGIRMQGLRMGQVTEEEPMGSLRPPGNGGQAQFLG